MHERRCVGHRRTSGVQSFIGHFGPCAHSRATQGRGRPQRWIGKDVFDVFEDDRGFRDRNSVVHKDRHQPAGINLEELGREMLLSHKVYLLAFPWNSFLIEGNPDFLRAYRYIVVIELEH